MQWGRSLSAEYRCRWSWEFDKIPDECAKDKHFENFSAAAALDDVKCLAVFYDAVFGRNAFPLRAGVEHRAAANDRAGAEHRVAADLGAVADDRAKFFEPGGNQSRFRGHQHLAMVELDVG